MKWHKTTSRKRPKVGRRIVALCVEGSGGTLIYFGCKHLTNAEGETDAESRQNFPGKYSHWAYLPKGYELWFESDHRVKEVA